MATSLACGSQEIFTFDTVSEWTNVRFRLASLLSYLVDPEKVDSSSERASGNQAVMLLL